MVKDLGKVALVGPGAVGGFYGGMLSISGVDLKFIFRNSHDEVCEKGLWLVHHCDDRREERVEPLRAFRDPREVGECDWVIVAIKSTANDLLEEIIKPMVGPGTNFLTLQNGMGNVENLAHAFGSNRTILAGLCFTCINRTKPNRIESLLPGYVQFGQYDSDLSERAEEMINVFAQAGIQVKRAESLDEVLWRKLCWNVPFNGLAIACGGITTDLILCDDGHRLRARRLMDEIQAAALAHEIEIEDSFLARQFALTEPMGPYKPSSLIDFLNGKAVEVESIWGEPLRRGESKGVEMKELRKLYGELKPLAQDR